MPEIDLSSIFSAVAEVTNGARRGTALGKLREVNGVQHTPELDRIMMIPRRVPLTPEEEEERIDLLTNYLRTPGGTMRLRPVQAQALFEAHDYQGLFGPIRVSGGKTLISLLAPIVLEAQRPMLIVPAALIEKTRMEARKLAQHWRLPTFLHIVSYQSLGRVSGAETLKTLNPDLIVCDEGHKLKNKRAAVTKRVARFMHDHPTTRMVILTGTISKRSLHDFAHLLLWSLKLRTPLPRHYNELEAWALAIDERPNAITPPLNPGAILKLATDEDVGEPMQRARTAVRRRINDTPGVVTASGEGCNVSLRVQGHVVETAKQTKAAFERLREKWETPDGWPLSDGLAIWRHARELALGFFYRWDPRPPGEWIEARKEWSKFCRKVLNNNRRNLDSEFQVALACKEHPEWYGDEEYNAWIAIRDTFKPRTVAIPFDDTILEYCRHWAQKSGGLIWCEHIDFAERLSTCTGLPYFAGEGLDASGASIEDFNGTSAILSIEANREGRNLQRFSKNLVVSPMQQGDRWQQLLARTHRDGQDADEVICDVVLSCAEHVEAMRIMLNDAQYQEDITGDRQKLLLADVVVPQTPKQGPIWDKDWGKDDWGEKDDREEHVWHER
jgi:hypothetical protein